MIATLARSLCSFPYGTFPVEEAFRILYVQEYSRARSYELSSHLPLHHPLLRQLEGIYPLRYTLPPWWSSCLEQITSEEVRQILNGVTPEEFRTGCIHPRRWKAFREGLTPEQRLVFASSPKIAGLLTHPDWEYRFKERGPVETPEALSLVISTHPRAFLYMSNGHDWRSCQHYQDGLENHRLPGNFYDTGVAVAMVLAAGTRVEDPHSVLARTTLRLFQAEGRSIVALGRVYDNHRTLALLLLAHLAELFDRQVLPWGFLSETETHLLCQEGLLGPTLRQRLQGEVWAEGEPFWLPEYWHTPYVDGGEHEWFNDWESYGEDGSRKHLEASIRLVEPRPHLAPDTQQHLELARLGARGLRPAFA